MHIYTYICIYTYIYIYIHINIYTHIHTYTHPYIQVCVGRYFPSLREYRKLKQAEREIEQNKL